MKTDVVYPVLIMVIVLQVYTLVKIYQIKYFRYKQLIMHQLYLNKIFKYISLNLVIKLMGFGRVYFTILWDLTRHHYVIRLKVS